MESNSTGTWEHYPSLAQRQEEAEKRERESSSSSLGSSTKGGAPATDICREPITDVALEEVARCDYYLRGKKVPAVGTKVSVSPTLVHGRIAVITVSRATIIGYLPTTYNYIRLCCEKGYNYIGKVTSSSASPLPQVTVTLAGKK